MSTRLTRCWLLELHLNSGSLPMLAAWNRWHRSHFKKDSRCPLLSPHASARRHSWRLQGVLGFTCTARGSSLEHVHLVHLPFPWGKSSGLWPHQLQRHSSKAVLYTNNNFGLYVTLKAAVHHSIDACLMITSEEFSLISHREDGWSYENLMILIFIHSHIAFVDFDFPWHVKTFRWTLTRLRSSGRYFPKV